MYMELFSNGLSFIESLVRQKSVTAVHNAAAQTGTAIPILNEVIAKSFGALGRVAQLPALPSVITPYIIFEQQLAWFTLFSLRVNRFASNMHSKVTGKGYYSFVWPGV